MSVALVAMMALGGCASGVPSLEAGTASLEGTRAIAVLSPRFAKIVQTPVSGQVVFVSENGSLTTTRTEGIDGGLISVDGDRAYFTDQHNDYVLDDGLTTIPRETREYSQELLVPEGDSYVSVFNSNYSEDGTYYQFDVSTGSGGEPAEARFPHYFELLGQCEGEVFGVAVPEGYSDVDRAPRTLEQLYPAASNSLRGEWMPARSSQQEGLEIPCLDRELYFLSVESTGDPASEDGPAFNGFRLRAWNVDTGEIRSKLLTISGGTPLPERNWEYPFLTRTSWSIHGDSFYWIDGNGTVLSSDIVTGVTTEIFTIPLDSPQAESNRVEFDGNLLHVFDLVPSGRTAATITTYRLLDGSIAAHQAIKGLRELAVDSDLYVSDFTVLD
jgi:hypothetical protein